MEMRDFGRTGMRFSILGFGCGAVGGLMVRGDARDREKAIGKALDAGINYFDTAVQYGDGLSETHLGQALAALKPKQAYVGTKVRIPSGSFGQIARTATESLDASLKRLGMDHVDIFHLHNPISVNGGGESLSTQQVLNEVVPAFESLQKAGKTRFIGITAVGDTDALHAAIDSGKFQSAQVSYNMLNPSAGADLPAGYPAQDYRRLFERTQAAGVGVVGIRVLAGGALSGVAERHPIASPPPAPIGSALDFGTDLQRAQRLAPLVTEGYAGSLAEAATRFAIGHKAMGSILVGMATIAEFEASLAAVLKGPLSAAALARATALTQGFVGEAR